MDTLTSCEGEPPVLGTLFDALPFGLLRSSDGTTRILGTDTNTEHETADAKHSEHAVETLTARRSGKRREERNNEGCSDLHMIA